jgi:DNA-binding Xre family transcriptional regulator
MKRIEYVFNNMQFMHDIREAMPKGSSLRDIQARTGINPSTLSRLDNGASIDMDTFLTICSKLDLLPGNYFSRRIWELQEGDNE